MRADCAAGRTHFNHRVLGTCKVLAPRWSSAGGRNRSRTVWAVSVGVALAFLTLPHPVALGAAASTPTVTPAQTRAVIERFYAAYNLGDLPGALATLGTQLTYADCDYARDMPSLLSSKQAMIPWLRARFAEHDHFTATNIAAGGIDANGTSIPNVANMSATRTNDILQAQGLPPQPVGAKVIVDNSGWIERVVSITFSDCSLLAPPTGPNQGRTRGLVEAFLDAYNAHDGARVLELVSPSVVLRDRSFASARTSTVEGRWQLHAWLRRRFHNEDNLGDISMNVGAGKQARVARVQALRRIDGFAPKAVSIVFMLGNKEGSEITRVGIAPGHPDVTHTK